MLIYVHVYMLRPDSQPLTRFEASQPILTCFEAGHMSAPHAL